MDTTKGKRALNKQQTRRTIRAAAASLFYERGFDQVTTTEVAEAAGVSPATLFNYFATKEDLFFGQEAQLERELVEVVTSCPSGESLLARLQRHVVHELTAGRATSNPAAVRPFHQQVVRSPSLRAHEHDMYVRREAVLAAALVDAFGPDADPLQPRLAAALYIAAEKVIAAELRRLLVRQSAPRALREISPFVDAVFRELSDGLGPLPAAAR